jgi:hypothetical protein
MNREVMAAMDRLIESKRQPSDKARNIAQAILALAFRPMEWQKEHSAAAKGGNLIDEHTAAIVRRDREQLVSRLETDATGAFEALDSEGRKSLEAWQRGIQWAIKVIQEAA